MVPSTPCNPIVPSLDATHSLPRASALSQICHPMSEVLGALQSRQSTLGREGERVSMLQQEEETRSALECRSVFSVSSKASSSHSA